VPRTNLHVLNATSVPAVLVEIGFLSNPTDKNNMKDPAFQDRLASAMARAVIDYLSSSAEGRL
jgi:N-acetylmuramoyl-L-alanine amidase